MRLTLLLLLWIGWIGAVAANANEDLLSLSLDELSAVTVQVPSDHAMKLQHAAATVYVVRSAEIVDRGWQHLGELLRDLPGVDFQDYSESTRRSRIGFRGIVGNQRFLILRDGARISAPSGDPIGILHNFPLYGLRQVEVAIGPSSAIYGADAYAAIINLVPDDAARRARISGGQFGSLSGEAVYDLALGDGARLALHASGHTSDNPDLAEFHAGDYMLGDLKTFGGQTVLAADQRSGYSAPTKSHTLGATLHLADGISLGFHRWRNEESSAHGSLTEAVDFGRDPTWATEVGSLLGSLERDHGGGWGSRFEVDYGWHRILNHSKFSNRFVDFEDGFKYARDETAALRARLQRSYADDGWFAAGAELKRAWGIPKTADLQFPYDPKLPISEQEQFYFGTGDSLRVKVFDYAAAEVGVFLQVEQALGERLRGSFGMRYDSHSRYGGSFNPRAGLVATLSPRWTLSAQYGEAFLSPAPLFVYEHFGAFDGTRNAEGEYQSSFFQIPNLDLKPEKLRSAETSLRWRSTRSLARLTAWASRVDDIIGFGATDEPQRNFIPGGDIAFTGQSQNSGELRAWGLELGGARELYFGGQKLQSWFSYTWTGGEFGEASDALPLVAAHKLKAGLTWESERGLSLTPTVRSIGATPIGRTGEENAGYTVVDLSAAWSHNGGGRLWLRATNLLDRRYTNATSGGGGLFLRAPQAPRFLIAGIDLPLRWFDLRTP